MTIDKHDINLVKKIKEVITEYSTVTRDNFKGNEVVKTLTKEIPQIIKDSNLIDLEKFIVKGSGGNGQPAEIPWVSIFNKDITTSATKGLYLVFLIKADKTGMYLSLNQGFTYFKNKYGSKDGKLKISKAACEIRKILKTLPKDSREHINLNCVNDLGKGYEAGNISSKYYDINKMPNDKQLIKEIKEYILAYDELKSIIGSRTIEQFYDYILINEDGYIINEEEEKNAVEAALSNKEELLNKFNGEKKDKKECVIDEGGKKRYPRDPKVAANALKIGHYKCAIDINHSSFTRKRDGENYTEPHHLIPISYHDNFEYSLDVEENIISLCSTCHNCLHYGIDAERIKLLEKLYDERNEVLKNVGLKITLEELKKYYKITD